MVVDTYQATIIVINLPEAICYCDGRHVCTKYHGHTHYYQATLLEIVINCLRLFLLLPWRW